MQAQKLVRVDEVGVMYLDLFHLSSFFKVLIPCLLQSQSCRTVLTCMNSLDFTTTCFWLLRAVIQLLPLAHHMQAWKLRKENQKLQPSRKSMRCETSWSAGCIIQWSHSDGLDKNHNVAQHVGQRSNLLWSLINLVADSTWRQKVSRNHPEPILPSDKVMASPRRFSWQSFSRWPETMPRLRRASQCSS